MLARYCPPYIMGRYLALDLCAGDGQKSEFSDLSSPAIFHHHAVFAQEWGLPVHRILIEKVENTFDALAKTPWSQGAELICTDARTFDLGEMQVPRQSAAFIHADPNHVEDWPLSKTLLNQMPFFTTTLITLGCNVSGIKRLDAKRRSMWHRRVSEFLSWMPHHHDALLIALNQDKSQWAYLISGPKSWEFKYRNDARLAFRSWQHGITVSSYKTERRQFEQVQRELFQTRKELDQEAA